MIISLILCVQGWYCDEDSNWCLGRPGGHIGRTCWSFDQSIHLKQGIFGGMLGVGWSFGERISWLGKYSNHPCSFRLMFKESRVCTCIHPHVIMSGSSIASCPDLLFGEVQCPYSRVGGSSLTHASSTCVSPPFPLRRETRVQVGRLLTFAKGHLHPSVLLEVRYCRLTCWQFHRHGMPVVCGLSFPPCIHLMHWTLVRWSPRTKGPVACCWSQ